MAKALGLKSPQPIMRKTGESGDMFQSDSKYYIWNLIEGDIWEIVMPVGLVDIVTKIAKLGVRSLKVCGGRSGVDFRLILGWEML
jgi:hypothetical protein